MGPTWGPSGSCRPQLGPMLAPWTFAIGGGLAIFYDPNHNMNAHPSYTFIPRVINSLGREEEWLQWKSWENAWLHELTQSKEKWLGTASNHHIDRKRTFSLCICFHKTCTFWTGSSFTHDLPLKKYPSNIILRNANLSNIMINYFSTK